MFRHKRYSTDTELSKYIRKLNDDSIQGEIKWNIAAYASFYKCVSRMCDLCLTEKLKIMRKYPDLLLNKLSELVSKGGHKNQLILTNSKDTLSGLRQFLATEIPSKMMKNVFLF